MQNQHQEVPVNKPPQPIGFDLNVFWEKVSQGPIHLCSCGRPMVPDQMRDGRVIYSCVFCHQPYYINHCWKCHSKIDSRFCRRSPIPNLGYICSVCQHDLGGYRGGGANHAVVLR
jgi:hypothetical protein